MENNVDTENENSKVDSANSKPFAFHKNSTGSQNQNKASSKSSCTNQSDQTNKSTDYKKINKDSHHIGKYRLVSTLGRGNFAKVKLATHVTTGLEVAVKVIDKTQLNLVSMKKLFREVDIMKTLNHPNIVKLYEVIESERHVYLVMEYVSKGELFDHLVNNGRMKEKFAREKFRQILSAIQYCHSKKIVHRDLKAENVLVDQETNMKIADFGFANHFGVNGKLDTFCGSPPYAAPELFQGKRYEGPEVDIWSLGVILYTIVSGSLPFDAQNLKELREKVLRGKYRVPYYLTAECEHLLKKMLILNPEKRHSLLSIMTDKWINLGYENDPLKPYIEPQINYNDPVKLKIMMDMGFSDVDILDTFKNKKFNNIHATYVLLEGYQSLKDLPQAAINLQGSTNSSTEKNKNDSHKTSSTKSPNTSENGQTLRNSSTVEDKDKSNEMKNKELTNGNNNNNELKINFSGPGENNKQPEEATANKKKANVTPSWMKPSTSAGPTSTSNKTSDNQPTLSAEDLDTIHDGIKSSHRPDMNKLSIERNLSPNPPSNVGTENWIRRNNTFSTSDKAKINNNPLHRVPPQLCINKTSDNNFDGPELSSHNFDHNSESDQANEALLTNSAKPTIIKTKPASEYNPMTFQKILRSFSRKSKNVNKSNFDRKDPNRATAPLFMNGNYPSNNTTKITSSHDGDKLKVKDDNSIPNTIKNAINDNKLSHWDGGEINPDMTMISLAHPEDVTVDSSEDANSFHCDKSLANMDESVMTAYNKSLINDDSLLIGSGGLTQKNGISLMDDEVFPDEKKIGKLTQIELRTSLTPVNGNYEPSSTTPICQKIPNCQTDSINDNGTLKKSPTASSTTATTNTTGTTNKSVDNSLNKISNSFDKKSNITGRNNSHNKSFKSFLICIKRPMKRKIIIPNKREIADNPWTPMSNSVMHSETGSRDDGHTELRQKKANTIDETRYISSRRSPGRNPNKSSRGNQIHDLLGCIRKPHSYQRGRYEDNPDCNDNPTDDCIDDKEKLMDNSPNKSSRTSKVSANPSLPPFSLGNYLHSRIRAKDIEVLKRAIVIELDANNVSYSTSEFEFNCQIIDQKSAHNSSSPNTNAQNSSVKSSEKTLLQSNTSPVTTSNSRSYFQVCLFRNLLNSNYGARIKYMSGDQENYQTIKRTLYQNINQKLNEL